MTVDFGDIERADTWDADATIAPEQVAMRLHRLRAELDYLAGHDAPQWRDLTPAEQELAQAFAVAVVGWVMRHEPDNAAFVAEQLHNVRVYVSGGVVREWDELADDERQIAIDLIDLILDWLDKEGPR